MKSQIKAGIIIGSVILFFVACLAENHPFSKREDIVDQDKITSRTMNCSCSISLNEENDFNFVGQIHNEIVCEYYELFNEEDQDIDLIIARVDSIANENTNYMAIKDSTHTSIDKNTILDGIDDVGNQFGQVIASLNLSDPAEQKLNVLVQYLYSWSGQEQSPTYGGISSYLSEFEESVIDSFAYYSERDKRVLMSCISTAKYSTCFWYQFSIEEVESTLNESQKRAKWLRVLVTVAADAVGAAVGAIPAAGSAGVAGSAIVGAAAAASTAAWNITNPNSK